MKRRAMRRAEGVPRKKYKKLPRSGDFQGRKSHIQLLILFFFAPAARTIQSIRRFSNLRPMHRPFANRKHACLEAIIHYKNMCFNVKISKFSRLRRTK